jgi:hypothetical protein
MVSGLGERLLQSIIAIEKDSMDIKFHQMDNDGQVSFVFPLDNIPDEALRMDVERHKEGLLGAVGAFYVNMIGQMVIRRNMRAFFEFYRDMSSNDYNTKLLSMEYVSFGMGCNGDYVSMVFHSSLLYNIFIALLNNTKEAN